MEIDEGCAEGVKMGGGFGDAWVRREKVCEELGGEASFFDLGEDQIGIGVEGYGEWGVFADLVLHGPDGFVEGVDDEVAGSGTDHASEVGWIVVDREGNGSDYVRGYGEGGALRVKAEREDEGAAPVWAELVKNCVGAENSGLGWVVSGLRRHSRRIVP